MLSRVWAFLGYNTPLTALLLPPGGPGLTTNTSGTPWLLAIGLLAGTFHTLAGWVAADELRGGPRPVARPTAPAPAAWIRVQHYAALQPVVRPGDTVYATCDRGVGVFAPARVEVRDSRSSSSAGDVTKLDERRFKAALDALGAVRDDRVQKAVTFSAIEDVGKYLRNLPRDVTWVDYHTEPGMTPNRELADIDKHVVEFADAVHKSGRQACWSPSNTMLRTSEERLLALAKHLDAIVLQHQKVMQFDGGDTMVRLTQSRAATIRRTNPRCRVLVQVAVGRGTTEDIVRAGRAVSSLVDGFSVFTLHQTDQAAAILTAVRGPGAAGDARR